MKKKTLIVLVCIIAVLTAAVSAYAYRHPTHWRFNDSRIIGTTLDSITEAYGKYDRCIGKIGGEHFTVAYMVRANTPEILFDGYDNSRWYCIHFEDGIAQKVYIMDGWIGG